MTKDNYHMGRDCAYCGEPSGRYELCKDCKILKDNKIIIKCDICGRWNNHNVKCACQRGGCLFSAFDTGLNNNDDIVNEKESKFLEEYKAKKYIAVDNIMNKTETYFYETIKSCLPSNYIIQPQISLNSIIQKISHERYQNELNRVVDFGIIDNSNGGYKIKLLIEINGVFHETEKYRQYRDYKVEELCKEAGIPLIKFWTKYENKQEYVQKRILSYL